MAQVHPHLQVTPCRHHLAAPQPHGQGVCDGGGGGGGGGGEEGQVWA
jgi:hypothetical protein